MNSLDHAMSATTVSRTDIEDPQTAAIEYSKLTIEKHDLVHGIEEIATDARITGVVEGPTSERTIFTKLLKKAARIETRNILRPDEVLQDHRAGPFAIIPQVGTLATKVTKVG